MAVNKESALPSVHGVVWEMISVSTCQYHSMLHAQTYMMIYCIQAGHMCTCSLLGQNYKNENLLQNASGPWRYAREDKWNWKEHTHQQISMLKLLCLVWLSETHSPPRYNTILQARDYVLWQCYWTFNSQPFLCLKHSLHVAETLTWMSYYRIWWSKVKVTVPSQNTFLAISECNHDNVSTCFMLNRIMTFYIHKVVSQLHWNISLFCKNTKLAMILFNVMPPTTSTTTSLLPPFQIAPPLLSSRPFRWLW